MALLGLLKQLQKSTALPLECAGPAGFAQANPAGRNRAGAARPWPSLLAHPACRSLPTRKGDAQNTRRLRAVRLRPAAVAWAGEANARAHARRSHQHSRYQNADLRQEQGTFGSWGRGRLARLALIFSYAWQRTDVMTVHAHCPLAISFVYRKKQSQRDFSSERTAAFRTCRRPWGEEARLRFLARKSWRRGRTGPLLLRYATSFGFPVRQRPPKGVGGRHRDTKRLNRRGRVHEALQEFSVTCRSRRRI